MIILAHKRGLLGLLVAQVLASIYIKDFLASTKLIRSARINTSLA